MSKKTYDFNLTIDNEETLVFVNPVNDNNTPICTEAQASSDRHLPNEIRRLFPDHDEQQVIKILKSIQDKIDRIWKRIDEKYEKCLKTPEIVSQMWKRFKLKYGTHLSQKYKLRAATMKQAMEILKQSSFGGLILNSKNEILAVQNYCGTWSALKGHLKIKENDELEIPWEAFLRELLEELSIRHTSVELTENNINKFITMNQEIYFECHVLNNRDDNHRIRRIGLFFICIDENNLQFNLADNKENQDWTWLKIDDILSDNSESEYDKYHTLRPFVQYLKDHPELLQNHINVHI